MSDACQVFVNSEGGGSAERGGSATPIPFPTCCSVFPKVGIFGLVFSFCWGSSTSNEGAGKPPWVSCFPFPQFKVLSCIYRQASGNLASDARPQDSAFSIQNLNFSVCWGAEKEQAKKLRKALMRRARKRSRESFGRHGRTSREREEVARGPFPRRTGRTRKRTLVRCRSGATQPRRRS